MSVDFLAAAVAGWPEEVAVTDGRRSWSWLELEHAVERLAATLGTGASGGVARGSGAASRRTVAFVLPPSFDAVVAIHAVLRTGALVAPLHPGLSPTETAAALDALGPEQVLVSADTRGMVQEAVALLPETSGGASRPMVRVVEGLLEETGSGGAQPAEGARGQAERDVDTSRFPAAPVAAIWTSGTSGRPRGILITAEALRHSARASGARLGLVPGDRWYASLSPAHVGGLALITRAALLGSALVATGSFDEGDLSALVDRGEVTHVSLVPTMLRRLLDHRRDTPPPASLRCLLVGGAACPPPLLQRALAAGMPVALTWGMTETTSQAATAPPDLVRRKPGTVGAPLEGVEVRIDGAVAGAEESAEDGTGGDGGEGGEGGEGEILVRGPVLAAGQIGEGGAPESLTDAGGWLRTGDLGTIDGEGHLRVTGRRSDRIITGGVNVDPAEVEAVLLDHPAVAEAAVLGVPDEEWGERVVAAVVARPGTADLGGLREWLLERLAGPKVPKEIATVDALPRNPNGKVDRAQLRRVLAGAAPP